MLGKLLKYEVKATARTLLPLYGAMIVFAMINRIFTSNGHLINTANVLFGFTAVIMAMLYSIIMAATFVMTFIIMIQRYYKNLLGDEGYLMHTLPVRPAHHITTKLIVSVFWFICTAIVTFISIVIIVYEPGMIKTAFQSLSILFINFKEELGFSPYIALIEMLLIGLSVSITSILLIYCSISIGHLANKHRKLTSFGAFLAITFIVEFLFACIGTALDDTAFAIWFSNLDPTPGVHYFTLICIAINGLVSTVYFTISNYVMKNKLNLD